MANVLNCPPVHQFEISCSSKHIHMAFNLNMLNSISQCFSMFRNMKAEFLKMPKSKFQCKSVI